MRHSVHIFLGDKFKTVAQELKQYVCKDEQLRPYFDAFVATADADGLITMAPAKDGITPVAPPETLQDAAAVCSFFQILFRNRVQITMQQNGDRAVLQLTVYVPLYDSASTTLFEQITKGVRASDCPFNIDVVGIGSDLARLFESDENEARNVKQDEVVAELMAIKNRELNLGTFQHFIPLRDVNSAQFALNLRLASFTRILGELAELFICDYDALFNIPVADVQRSDILAVGLSEAYLDADYFMDYLQRKAFVHAMEREGVSAEEVDVSKIGPAAQQCMKDAGLHRDLSKCFSQFWAAADVNSMQQAGKSDEQIVAELTPKIAKLFDEELPQLLEGYLGDEQYTLAERKGIMSLLLGQDDDRFTGDLYDTESQLYVDDIVGEPMQVFVDENNRAKKVIEDNGRKKTIHLALTAPLDENDDVYVPLREMRKLRGAILSSSKYIREQEADMEAQQRQLSDAKDSEIRLVDNRFEYGGRQYGLQQNVSEHAIEEDYQPSKVTLEAVDLREHFSKVRDQAVDGPCASFAVTSVVEYFQHKYGIEENYSLSPSFVFYHARKRIGDLANTVKGTSIYDNIEAIHEIGVCPEDAYPYDPQALEAEPNSVAMDAAKGCTIEKALNIPLGEDTEANLNALRSALSEGLPVIAAIAVYKSFSAHRGFVPLPDDNEEMMGYHAVVVCGYSDEHRYFIVRNSWGTQFGDNGYCYLPYSYLTNKELCTNASVITKVQPDKQISLKAEVHKVAFDETDARIKYAITANKVMEEKRHLKLLKKMYEQSRASFVNLLMELRRNNVRKTIADAGSNRLGKTVTTIKAQIKARQDGRITELKKHRDDSRKYAIKLFAGLAVLTAVFGYCWWAEMFSAAGTVTLILLGLMAIFTALFVSKAMSDNKRIDAEYKSDINKLVAQKEVMEKEQSLWRIKAHLAGAFIDQYDALKNSMMDRWHALGSFAGNLRTWHEQEQKNIESMSAETQLPFVSILNNETLDAFFESHKDMLTGDIHLSQFFSADYTLNQEGIKKFRDNLIAGVRNSLGNALNDFSMWAYLTGERTYSYLPDRNNVVRDVMTQIDNRGMVFTRYSQLRDQSADVRYLLIHTDPGNDNQRSKWRKFSEPYFTMPTPNDKQLQSRFKLILLRLKPLAPDEIVY